MVDNSNTRQQSHETRPYLVWVNSELAEVSIGGVIVGAVRQRVDGRWDAVLGHPTKDRRLAAKRVLGAYLGPRLAFDETPEVISGGRPRDYHETAAS